MVINPASNPASGEPDPVVFNTDAHFSDNQIRRYLYQFMRIFSGITVLTGKGSDGTRKYRPVPIRPADSDRQVATILSNNTENIVAAMPMMFSYISGLQPDRSRTLNPTFEDAVQITEKVYDDRTRAYVNRPGRRTSVERLMPAPYGLTCNLDIIASNVDNRIQCLEQILPMFNPALEIYSTDSVVDWTRLTVVELTDITYASRPVPMGQDLSYDMTTMVFTMPIWISPPVRVERQILINNIRSNIFQMEAADRENVEFGVSDYFGDRDPVSESVLVPANNSISVDDRHIELRGEYTDPAAKTHSWADLFAKYDLEFVSGKSRVVLRLPDGNGDITKDVIAYLHAVKDRPHLVSYTVDRDTLQLNDYIVSGIINPTSAASDPARLAGGLYLLVDADPDARWDGRLFSGSIPAAQNDIVNVARGTDGDYELVFRAHGSDEERHIYNEKTGKQYRWDPHSKEWHSPVEGDYGPEHWKFIP